MMITVGINGAAGQMGKALVRLVGGDPAAYSGVAESKDLPEWHGQAGLSLKLALEHVSHSQIGQDAGTVAGLAQPLGIPITCEFEKAERSGVPMNIGIDVIIGFSLSVGTMACLKGAQKYRVPLVIGT
ncbi:hypothetical protein HY772_08305, partial [Candidatus Woesearchaeota archaeon]|nr:hypothetical protein [Candidatus Woesearchaeota archaeon]